ncbi:MAG: threonine/serine exporter family protein [Spirochaetia bacterium]|jgi:uncharacterized membrane protein YjjB (DUF3815 family)|uniref:Membrane spanning protein (Modular protein) n=2 Tax=root TaxID=1 RepID=A0A652ZV97_9SPIR|nr:threonine/serine exporter family protein [Spirochaetia bacterium]MDD3820303.1 threonine/serine exporter family protein [Spirochaetales bacterium]NLX46389.1 threonine/serine exporter [Treponema sp.]VBB39700.1 Membrane spanning protein (modular protein) [uncultured Spirochaetota bacterium]MCE1208234.1 threonine/serine exporter family protein [Spirochaetia bacterium]
MNPQLSGIFSQLKEPLFAGLATSAFSVLFGLHSADVILASGGSALGWAVLQAMPQSGSPAFATFFAALAAGLYAEIAARVRRRPATLYMIASIIPLVPGGGMYYTMLSSLEGSTYRSVELGLSTIMTAFAIAAGLAISNVLARMVFSSTIYSILKKRKIFQKPDKL